MDTAGLIVKIEEEAKELKEKISRLADFLGSSKYENLNKAHQKLLYSQYKAMKNYHACLEDRIELLKKDL